MTSPIGPADAIFLALADLSDAERAALLQERCGHDPRLRAEVDAMMQALDDADDRFLDPDRMPALDPAAIDGPLQPGTILGRYLVLHAIGSGGMGVVYAAQQDHPQRTVAIKVLRPGLRHPAVLKRFEREAEVLARLQHPGIAQVFAFVHGSRRVPAHLVMEFVSGPPITEYVRAHALGHAARIERLIAVCEAVQHAHDRGIIHRDLKPANVLVANDGRPKVLDFGIARVRGLDLQSTVRTAHGELLGTLAYMSPEQLRGATDEIDGRSDVYALGVMFYRLMAGRLPIDVAGLSLLDAAYRILHTPVPSLGTIDPSLDGPIAEVARRAMSPDREQRYQSAADLANDLCACLEGRTPAPPHTATAPPSPVRRSRLVESHDGRAIAVGLGNGTVVVLDAVSGTPLATIPGDGTPLAHLAFEADGRLAMTWVGGRVERTMIPGRS